MIVIQPIPLEIARPLSKLLIHRTLGGEAMNNKAIALGIVGILLMSINLAVISPMVMGITEEKLAEATIMTEETWEDDDWLNATSERSFFAWNLNNVGELQQDDDAEKEFEKLGPITYN